MTVTAVLFVYQTKQEIERRRRIRLSLWAYAYEMRGESLVSDKVFDEEARKVDLSVDTGNAKMDKWFKENFADYTGSWIGKHPELDKLAALYERLYK